MATPTLSPILPSANSAVIATLARQTAIKAIYEQRQASYRLGFFCVTTTGKSLMRRYAVNDPLLITELVEL
jgi:hypothetical protein